MSESEKKKLTFGCSKSTGMFPEYNRVSHMVLVPMCVAIKAEVDPPPGHEIQIWDVEFDHFRMSGGALLLQFL